MQTILFVAVFLGYNKYCPGGFMVLSSFFMSKSTQRLNHIGSGFKASQKMGPQLKVLPDRLGEAGNRTCDPLFKSQMLLSYTTEVLLKALGLVVSDKTILCVPNISLCKTYDRVGPFLAQGP